MYTFGKPNTLILFWDKTYDGLNQISTNIEDRWDLAILKPYVVNCPVLQMQALQGMILYKDSSKHS